MGRADRRPVADRARRPPPAVSAGGGALAPVESGAPLRARRAWARPRRAGPGAPASPTGPARPQGLRVLVGDGRGRGRLVLAPLAARRRLRGGPRQLGRRRTPRRERLLRPRA